MGVWCAAKEGGAQTVAAWLDASAGGMDARCAERGSRTLLMAAAHGGQVTMVQMLLQRGASVNQQALVRASTCRAPSAGQP